MGVEQRADVWHRERVGGLGAQDAGSGVKGAGGNRTTGDRATTDSGIGVISIISVGAAEGAGKGGGWSAGCGTLEATYRRLRLRLDVQLVLCPHSRSSVADADAAIHALGREKGRKENRKGPAPEAMSTGLTNGLMGRCHPLPVAWALHWHPITERRPPHAAPNWMTWTGRSLGGEWGAEAWVRRPRADKGRRNE